MSATTAMIVQSEQAVAERQIGATWKAYQAVERHGLEFGRICYEWQKKLSAQGSRTGGGLRPTLDKVGIPHSTAYYWITRFKESQGLVSRPESHNGSQALSTSDEPPMPEPSDSPDQPELKNELAKPSSCHECGAQFPSKNQLKRHACDAHGVDGADFPRWLHKSGDDFVPSNPPSPDDIAVRVRHHEATANRLYVLAKSNGKDVEIYRNTKEGRFDVIGATAEQIERWMAV